MGCLTCWSPFVCMHASSSSTHVQRLKVNTGCLPLWPFTSLLETRILNASGAGHFGYECPGCAFRLLSSARATNTSHCILPYLFFSLPFFFFVSCFLKATSLFTEDLTQVLTLAHPAIFYPMGIFSALNIQYTCPFFFSAKLNLLWK